jgi:hypothetical protein
MDSNTFVYKMARGGKICVFPSQNSPLLQSQKICKKETLK